MNLEPKCGLLANDRAVPLEGVRIEARLSGACADVTVTQRYRNRESVPVEAVYVFPLDPAAAVCGFAALVAGKLIRGRVEERDKAFAAYDDAMLEGHGAFLLDQERPNIFTASVGNLRAGEAVELQIRYVCLAGREGDALRLVIPTTVSPRFVPATTVEVGQPDAERINPEHWPRVPYGLELKVEIEGASLRRVESPSHPVRTTLNAQGASVELAQEQAALDSDFVLLIEKAEPRLPEVRVAREQDGRRVTMVTFLPDDVPQVDQGHELLFLLDCSGSMRGESIAQAKRALSLCIRALSTNDTFNVVCFGSSFRALWTTPRAYDDKSLDEATQHVARIEADLGGTEILAPLRALLEGNGDAQRPRRVLLMTDGQVSNEAEIIALAKRHAESARIFTFGIGRGASEHLVRGTARASRAAAEMIFPGERIEPKVMRMFNRVRTAALDDVRVSYAGLQVEQAPAHSPPMFAGDVLTVFARIESGSASHVELTAGGHTWTLPLDLERAESDGPIPTLWARERMRELEDGESPRGSSQRRPEADQKRRERLAELGTRYGLLCSETSFVAVEERAPSDRTTQSAELRRIPVALTSGWGGGDRAPSALLGAAKGLVAYSMAIHVPSSQPPAFVPMARSLAVSSAPASGAGFFARAKQAIFGEGGSVGDMRDDDASEHDQAFGDFVSEALPQRQAAQADRVFELLMTQRADGSFARSVTLETWLGARAAKVWQSVGAQPEEVVVTSVVIALLEREERSRESEWRPAVSKAKAWLAKQKATFEVATLL